MHLNNLFFLQLHCLQSALLKDIVPDISMVHGCEKARLTLRCDVAGFFLSATSHSCQPCGCSSAGSVPSVDCDAVTGQCLCKPDRPGTTGRACDSCLLGYYRRSSSYAIFLFVITVSEFVMQPVSLSGYCLCNVHVGRAIVCCISTHVGIIPLWLLIGQAAATNYPYL